MRAQSVRFGRYEWRIVAEAAADDDVSAAWVRDVGCLTASIAAGTGAVIVSGAHAGDPAAVTATAST